ncbi:MAG: septum formation initiator family protein [Deltaproteobacteria bacterium]|nr:septum formation initiator family protein [Deltaproteobacteria bacterium]
MRPNSQKIKLQNNIFLTAAVVVFVLFFFVTVWGDGGLVELYGLKQQRDKIVASNRQLLQENLLRLQEIQKLKESRFVEQKARSDLGMIRKDEIVFVIKP